jgi:hypothetical protein
VGVKKYVDSHPTLGKMKTGLYSQCMGGNSQYEAIYRRPDLFANVLCMCSPLVPSMAAIFSAFSELQGVSQYQELIDLELLKMGAFLATRNDSAAICLGSEDARADDPSPEGLMDKKP